MATRKSACGQRGEKSGEITAERRTRGARGEREASLGHHNRPVERGTVIQLGAAVASAGETSAGARAEHASCQQRPLRREGAAAQGAHLGTYAAGGKLGPVDDVEGPGCACRASNPTARLGLRINASLGARIPAPHFNTPKISSRERAGTRNSLCQGISKPGLYASTEHMGRGGSEVLRINLDCAPKSLHRGVFVLTPKAARESIPRSTLLHWQPPRLLSPPNGTKTGPLLHCTKDPHCGGLTRRSYNSATRRPVV